MSADRYTAHRSDFSRSIQQVRHTIQALLAAPPAARYAIAIVATVLAVLLTLLLRPLTAWSPFLFALPTVAWSCWYGGVGPGFTSTIVAASAIGILLPRIAGGSTSAQAIGAVQALLFVGGAAILCDLGARWRAAHDAERQDQAEVERLERERDQLALQAQAAAGEAEAARARFSFVTEASDLLSTSLDYDTTLQRVARLAVSHLADWCVIDVLGPAGNVRRVAVVHRDAAVQSTADELLRYPPRGAGDRSILKVIATGTPTLLPVMNADDLEREAVSATHLDSMTRLDLASGMIVPLMARGKTLGAITLSRAGTRDSFTQADLASAQDLARRAALGVDNALLYKEAQKELAERRRAEAELARHQVQIELLNTQLQRAMTETHHRVKNNLQIIAAMVDMRVLDGTPTVPTSELERIGAHIRTLAAVHDILTHQAKGEGRADEISAKEVLDKLLPMLQAAAGLRPIVARADEARLTTRQCTSLAVVTTELVNNAIKYGLGEVDVLFHVHDDEALLEVIDDGPGFPPDFDPVRSANTGLELVQHLSRWDLGGHAEFENRADGGGARVLVHIPLSQPQLVEPARHIVATS